MGDGVKVGVTVGVGVWDGITVAVGEGVCVQVTEGVSVADRVGDGSNGVSLAGIVAGADEHAPAARITIKAGSHKKNLFGVICAAGPPE